MPRYPSWSRAGSRSDWSPPRSRGMVIGLRWAGRSERGRGAWWKIAKVAEGEERISSCPPGVCCSPWSCSFRSFFLSPLLSLSLSFSSSLLTYLYPFLSLPFPPSPQTDIEVCVCACVRVSSVCACVCVCVCARHPFPSARKSHPDGERDVGHSAVRFCYSVPLPLLDSMNNIAVENGTTVSSSSMNSN